MKAKKEKNSLSRTLLAIKNSIFNFVYQIINTIINLIVPPLIITNYGSAVNGLISTIKQLINYIQIVGAGIAESTVVSLYKPITEKDTKKVSAIYNACQYAFNSAGIIFSILSLAISFVYPLFVSGEGLSYFLIVFVILSLCIAGASEFFVIGKCRALLTADQKLYIINLAQIIGSVISTAVTILLINLNMNIVIVELATSITYFLRLIILISYVKKHYPYLDKTEAKDMKAISKRKDATVHQLASLIIFGSQTLFIANFCGLKEVSVYSVYNLVFVGINTILSTASSAMLPGFGNVMAVESKEKLKHVYNIYEMVFYILSFLIFTVTLIMIIPFVSIYTRGITDVNYIRYSIAVLFTIMGLLNCIRTPGATIINAGGYYKETKNRALIEMLLCIIFQFIFVHRFGVIGILFGTIIAYLYRTIDVLIFSHKYILKNNLKKSIIRILSNMCLMIITVTVSEKFFAIVCNNYVSFILTGFIVFVIVAIIFITSNYLLDRKSFKNLKTYVVQLVKRK